MTERQRLLVTGPVAVSEFLDQLANSLRAKGAEVILALDLKSPSEHSGWDTTDILVSYATPCQGRDMDSAPHLRAIITPSLGFEGIDVAAATSRGIIVANGQARENYQSVAEAAVMLTLMALYDVTGAQRKLSPQRFAGAGRLPPRMLSGKTVGIIGYGNIAKELVARLQHWNVRIKVHTRSPRTAEYQNTEFVSLDDVIKTSDVLIPFTPLTEETHHLINRQRLIEMKESAVLLNLSRGGVIDEEALGSPEISGRLRMIVLDVFEHEPLPESSPLLALENTILTPHEIARTQENSTALYQLAVENVDAVLGGRIPRSALNPHAWRR